MIFGQKKIENFQLKIIKENLKIPISRYLRCRCNISAGPSLNPSWSITNCQGFVWDFAKVEKIDLVISDLT